MTSIHRSRLISTMPSLASAFALGAMVPAEAATVTWFGPSASSNSNASWTAGGTSAQHFGVAFKTGSAASSYSMGWLRIGLSTAGSATSGSGSLKVSLRSTDNTTAYSAIAGTTVHAEDTITFTSPTTAATNFFIDLVPDNFTNISAFDMSADTGYALVLWGPSAGFGIQRTTGYANGTTNDFYTVNDGFVALDTFRNGTANWANITGVSYPTLSIAFGGSAVPEPATFALFGFSVAGLALRTRRRSH